MAQDNNKQKIPFSLEAKVRKEYANSPPIYVKISISGTHIPGYREQLQKKGEWGFFPTELLKCAEYSLNHNSFSLEPKKEDGNRIKFDAIPDLRMKLYVENDTNSDLYPSVILSTEELAYSFLKAANKIMFELKEKGKTDLLRECLAYKSLDTFYSNPKIKSMFDDEGIEIYVRKGLEYIGKNFDLAKKCSVN